MMTIKSKYFHGNEVSSYGQEHGYVDYRTLAQAFDAVMSNDLIKLTEGVIGYWEQESGFIDNSEQIKELREQIEELENSIEEQNEETGAIIADLEKGFAAVK